jgi:hypothetical protein
LNASRYHGIDNAAHVGGFVCGFIMGLLLSRPLDAGRNAKTWTMQWTIALGLLATSTMIVAHLISTGALAPRAAYDNDGRIIPRAALAPPISSLGGFTLHMTADEVLREKGRPIYQDKSSWVYNSIDSRHDGVLTVFFSHPGANGVPSVVAIEFIGHDETSAPPEIPYLNSLHTAEVIRRYGQPIENRAMSAGLTMLWFQNGLYVGARDSKVYRYGIVDLARFQN